MSTEQSGGRGLIHWMLENRVTPNLIMLFLILGGLYMSTRIKQEVFPEFATDAVTVTVAYPGASPEEVEQSVVLALEEAVRGLDGVKEVTAIASEGRGFVRAEVMSDADEQKIYQEIQQQVARVRTFPLEAEEPEVKLESRRRDVLSLMLYGKQEESVLRELAEMVRDRLVNGTGVTQVELQGVRKYEVHVEIPEARLRAHGLTLAEVAQRIRSASVDVPGGKIETTGGEVLLRVKDRRDWARQFAQIPIISTAEGTVVHLADIAEVKEGFEDSDNGATFNGERGIEIEVFRVGEQTPISVSDAVRALIPEIERDLPPGVSLSIRNDSSEMYRQRLGLLLKNAFYGLLLVLFVLGLFLEFRLAFWVTMGIPTAFLGGLLFLPWMGVSINMISLFAFIVALGIVVDDAIIAGENIYEYRQQGMSFREAALQGAKDVSVPIAFSILTNIVAFIPLLFMPGTFGQVWVSIPLVVITVFTISWAESLLILPSHLAHTKERTRSKIGDWLHGRQRAFTAWFNGLIEHRFGPFLAACIRWRGLTVACGFAVLIVTVGYVISGRMGMILLPRVESDRAVVTAMHPVGSPLSAVLKTQAILEEAIAKVAAAHGGEKLVIGVRSQIKESELEVTAYLTDPEVRPLSTSEVTKLWREIAGPIGGLQSMKFEADRGGPGSGAAISVELSHRNIRVLDRASAALAERLADFPNVKDIDDGYTPGKTQLDFKILPDGESLGLTSTEIARQVRNAFYGAEALRQQRGRHEVKVMVRLPDAERNTEHRLENLMIATPAKTYVPLMQVAEVERGNAFTSINRRDGRRTIMVTADVDPLGMTSQIKTTLDESLLPQLARDFPGLTYGYQGRQQSMEESTGGLKTGFILALFAIYFLLAIPFRSYTQPLIVMLSIPFGIVGAVLGHMMMDYNLSLMSLMGIIALAGVAVNDSLVLIDYANKLRSEGATARQAILDAAVRRFRPIMLTTLTTFGGLAPMIFETSRQAKYLIPMAISLGYGILFSTLIALILIPCMYVMIDDIARYFRRGKNSVLGATEGAPPLA